MRPGFYIPMLLLLSCSAGGCASAYRPNEAKGAGDHMKDVLNQPFADLNLSRQQLPAILSRAAAAPFQRPDDCEGLAREIAALSFALGPALSRSAAPPASPQSSDHNAEAQAWNTARSATGGLIPFRGVIRWLSGADQQERQIQQAVLSGYVRRAYLEGIRDAEHCGAIPSATVPTAPHDP